MSNTDDSDSVSVLVVLKGKAAKRFKRSVEQSGRSNRREARLRMEDHLMSIEHIAAIGKGIKRNGA